MMAIHHPYVVVLSVCYSALMTVHRYGDTHEFYISKEVQKETEGTHQLGSVVSLTYIHATLFSNDATTYS